MDDPIPAIHPSHLGDFPGHHGGRLVNPDGGTSAVATVTLLDVEAIQLAGEARRSIQRAEKAQAWRPEFAHGIFQGGVGNKERQRN